MRPQSFVILILLACNPGLHAQAVTVIEPPDDYLLHITKQWAADSPLGLLTAFDFGTDDIELRVWGGYGLTGTEGVVIRRQAGRWRGWTAEVVTCPYSVPIAVGDTASQATVRRFEQTARSSCGVDPGTSLPAARMFDFDTLAVRPLPDTAPIADAWNAAIQHGVLELPPQIPRKWMMLDGFTYVVEVRLGPDYRASVIEHVTNPEAPADGQVKQIYRTLFRLAYPAMPHQ